MKIKEQKIDEFLTALAGLAGRGLAGMGTKMAMAGGRMAAPALRAKAKKQNLLKSMAAKNVLKRSQPGSETAQGAAKDARASAFERINARRKEKGITKTLDPNKKFKQGQAEKWRRSARFEALLQDIRNRLDEGSLGLQKYKRLQKASNKKVKALNKTPIDDPKFLGKTEDAVKTYSDAQSKGTKYHRKKHFKSGKRKPL